VGSVGTFVARGSVGRAGFLERMDVHHRGDPVATFISLMSGNVVAGVFHAEFGWNFTATWIVVAVVVLVLVTVIHELGIAVSANVQRVVSIAEILFFVVLSIALIVAAKAQHACPCFSPHAGTSKDSRG